MDVRQDDRVDIIRVKNNPGGKWLARSVSGNCELNRTERRLNFSQQRFFQGGLMPTLCFLNCGRYLTLRVKQNKQKCYWIQTGVFFSFSVQNLLLDPIFRIWPTTLRQGRSGGKNSHLFIIYFTSSYSKEHRLKNLWGGKTWNVTAQTLCPSHQTWRIGLQVELVRNSLMPPISASDYIKHMSPGLSAFLASSSVWKYHSALVKQL